MDSKSLSAVKELGALCKEEKRMWALAAFESDWGSAPEPVEQVVSVPVCQAVVEPEEVVPPRVRVMACRVDLPRLTTSVSLTARPPVDFSLFSTPPVPATTSWSAATREVLDNCLVRLPTKKQYSAY